jgi:hypothetical protein
MSSASTRAVFALRPARLLAYREPAFFNIMNYEQVLNGRSVKRAICSSHSAFSDVSFRISGRMSDQSIGKRGRSGRI